MCLHWELKRINNIVAGVAGIVFFTGNWISIDASAVYPSIFSENKIYALPLIFSCLGFAIINCIPIHLLQNDILYKPRCSPKFLWFVLFAGFFIIFCALIGAWYILINDFILSNYVAVYPGIAVLLSNLMVFASAMIFRFGIKEDGAF